MQACWLFLMLPGTRCKPTRSLRCWNKQAGRAGPAAAQPRLQRLSFNSCGCPGPRRTNAWAVELAACRTAVCACPDQVWPLVHGCRASRLRLSSRWLRRLPSATFAASVLRDHASSPSGWHLPAPALLRVHHPHGSGWQRGWACPACILPRRPHPDQPAAAGGARRAALKPRGSACLLFQCDALLACTAGRRAVC
jgi:hypothetical protein